MKVLDDLAVKARMVLRFDAIAFILGLGYVMGLRASTLLCAGGVLSNFVLVPLIWFIGRKFPDAVVYPGTLPIAEMTGNGHLPRLRPLHGRRRHRDRRHLRHHQVAQDRRRLVLDRREGLPPRRGRGLERTDRDMAIMKILVGVVVSTVAVAIFLGNLDATSVVVLIGLGLTLVFSFFFTSVAANAIATTARNPVSGMTMLTIIISSLVLLEFGVSGRTGMFFVMAIAGMVCTALSVSGQTITDLKTGYWLGSTPAVQERVKFLRRAGLLGRRRRW